MAASPGDSRHGPGSLLALCACALALVSLAFPAERASAKTHPLRTGVSYVYSTDNDPIAFQNVRRAGARLVLTPLSWGRIVPSKEPVGWQPDNPADPNYNWHAYDLWVVRAVEAGLTPVLQVRGAPIWASRCPSSDVDTPCDPDPAALAAFATAAARRYSGTFAGLPRVQYWQGLNEPNLSFFFTPQFEGDRAVAANLYRDLINGFYVAVKAVDPSNLVLAAGLGPITVPGHTVGPMRFTRELLCMRGRDRFRPARGDCGAPVRFDIFDIHPYTTGSPAHQGGANDVQLGDLPKLKALLKAADQAGRIEGAFPRTPLWITELSWDSNPPDPGGLPMKILTRWTAEALHVAWRAGISDFFWFSLRDVAPSSLPAFQTLQSGLYFRGANIAEDQPKEQMYAFRFPFVAYPTPQGLSFWGRTPSGKRGLVAIQARERGGWRKVAAVRADAYGIFRGIAKTGYGRNKRGTVRAHYADGSSVPFSMRPVPDFPHPPFGAPVG